MNDYGIQNYYESGTDDTLQKIVKRMFADKNVLSLSEIEFYRNIITNFKTH